MSIHLGQFERLFIHVISYVVLMNLLVYSYLSYQAPIWGYLGYPEDYSEVRHIVANIICIIFALLVPIRVFNLTSFTLFIVTSTSLVAMAAMYAARGYDTAYLLSVIVFMLIFKLLAERIRFRIPARKSSAKPALALSLLFFGLAIAWVVARGGLSNLSFDILAIYDFRSLAYDRYFSGPFAYVLNWAIKAFGPTLLAYGIIRKSPLAIFIAIAGELFFYATLAQKTPLAIVIFVFLAIYISKRRPSVLTLNIIIIAAILLSQVLTSSGDIAFYATFTGRLFFSLASNNIAFFEFFSENSFTYFSTTFLRGIIDSPYDTHIFRLISLEKSGIEAVNPNTGILGTGYQHMGYLGLLVYAILSGLILSILESLAKHVPNWLPLAIGGIPIFVMFTSADLPVAMVTNGGFVILVLLFVWPREGSEGSVAQIL